MAKIFSVAISVIGVLFFGYLVAKTPNAYFLFSIALSLCLLSWRLVPKTWLGASVGVGSGILGVIGVVGGIAQRSPVLIVLGLLCCVGIIAPFKHHGQNAV